MSEQNFPDFLVVGASRSGTTTLWNALRKHPQIFLPSVKELHYFSREVNYQKGPDHYSSFFDGATSSQMKGEVSPTYFYAAKKFDLEGQVKHDPKDDSASRIKALLPNVKIVITLRDPVERMYSQYCKRRFKGTETNPSLLDCLREEQDGIRRPESSRGCYLFNSDYALHVKKWFSLFPRQNCHVMIFEEWIKDTQSQFKSLFEFLEVDPEFAIAPLDHKNKGRQVRFDWSHKTLGSILPKNLYKKYKQLSSNKIEPLSAQDYCFISEQLTSSVSTLETILNRDLSIWSDSAANR